MDRFWDKVIKLDSCWEWAAYCAKNGYGRFGNEYAHRVSYEMHFGPIPKGMTIDHLCGNRCCVNPEHLEVVTRGENTLRGNSRAALNARKVTCDHGHPLSGDNLYIYEKTGARLCRACRRERDARRPSGWARQRMAAA